MSRRCLVLLLASLAATAIAGHRGRAKHHRGRQRDRPFFRGPPSRLWESMGSHTRFDEVANHLNWFESDRHNPFLSAFFSLDQRAEENRPWWQGPNVCEKKIEEVKNATEKDGNDIMVHYTSSSQQCDLSESAYKCRLIEENVEGRRDVTIIYECCHGHSRVKADFGCPTKLKLKNVVDKAKDLGLTEFLQAVKMLQLTDQLRAGNFTVFAPLNGAFGLESDLIKGENLIQLGKTKFQQDDPAAFEVSEPALERTIQTLQGALLGHMIAGARRSSSLNDEEVLDTGHFEGSTIRINYFSRPEKLMTANCIPVASRDNVATNGIIHTVERALKPVTETLLDLVRTRPDLTLLKTVLAAAEYVPKLEEEGKYTLLAPTNGAFQKMSRRLRERLLSGDKKCIESVLLNHMLPNVICSAAFQKSSMTKNLLNKYLRVTRTDEGKLFVNDAQVVSKDIMGLNGVMHIVDDVMIPEEALGFLDVLEQKGLNELINLVEEAGLTKTLETATNVTLFAPTNEAIQNIPLGLKSKLLSDTDLLKKVLTYHMSPSQGNLQHFHNNQLIPSLEGRQVRLNRYASNPFYHSQRTAQCVPMEGKATKTCNGQLSVMSGVMIPPRGNLVDVLATDKRFSTLVSYLKKAGLDDILSGEGPFTIFAPNNQAFDQLEKRALDSLLSDREQLAKVLKNHVFQDTLCCAGISRESWYGGNRLRTLSWTTHRVTLNRYGEPMVGHAKIVKCDRTASNGNILEIGQVLWNVHSLRRNHLRRRYHRNGLRRWLQP